MDWGRVGGERSPNWLIGQERAVGGQRDKNWKIEWRGNERG